MKEISAELCHPKMLVVEAIDCEVIVSGLTVSSLTHIRTALMICGHD